MLKMISSFNALQNYLDDSSDSETEAVQKAKVSVNKPALKKVKEDSSSEESSDEEEEVKPKPVVKPTIKQKATESSSG